MRQTLPFQATILVDISSHCYSTTITDFKEDAIASSFLLITFEGFVKVWYSFSDNKKGASEMAENPQENAENKEKPLTEEEILAYLYPKSYECPVCDKEFTEFILRKSKLRVVTVETDFRTIYKDIDPNHYEVIFCSHCGYATLHNYFDSPTERQRKLIKEKICSVYKPHEFIMPLPLESVMERYKQALKCADAIEAKESQKAFICLKLAWVLRGKGDKEKEMIFLKQAYEGLKLAFGQERFPLGAMDESTAKYVIADLARRLGEMGEAMRWVGDVVVARGIPGALKERASLLKDLIREGSRE